MKEIDHVNGPYINTSGYKYVQIFYKDGTKKTTTYARYLIEQSIGRSLNENEEVDHKDDDKTNDSLENLQILSHKENVDKMNRKYYGRKNFKFICPACNKEAIKYFAIVLYVWNNGSSGPFCTQNCAYDARQLTLVKTKKELEFLANKFNFKLKNQHWITDGEICYDDQQIKKTC